MNIYVKIYLKQFKFAYRYLDIYTHTQAFFLNYVTYKLNDCT